MSRPSLTKLEKLERILDSHAAWERRTLADLHNAGYKFATVEQAFRHRQALRTRARLDEADLIDFIADHLGKKESRN